MTGFFQEKEGVNSIMRINTSLLVWAGLLIALVTVFMPLSGMTFDAGQNYTFSVTLIGMGLSGKVLQKFKEK